MESIRQAIK